MRKKYIRKKKIKGFIKTKKINRFIKKPQKIKIKSCRIKIKR